MTKKISFLFVCLMAFALGYSINNIAISDTAPKIAVVDVQQIVANSSQVKQLKADQEKKLGEMQKTIQQAQAEISKEKDPAKITALEEKYRNQINDQKVALDKDYNDKLTKIDSEIRTAVVEKAKSLNYNLDALSQSRRGYYRHYSKRYKINLKSLRLYAKISVQK